MYSREGTRLSLLPNTCNTVKMSNMVLYRCCLNYVFTNAYALQIFEIAYLSTLLEIAFPRVWSVCEWPHSVWYKSIRCYIVWHHKAVPFSCLLHPASISTLPSLHADLVAVYYKSENKTHTGIQKYAMKLYSYRSHTNLNWSK